jgi:hypothetical protein
VRAYRQRLWDPLKRSLDRLLQAAAQEDLSLQYEAVANFEAALRVQREGMASCQRYETRALSRRRKLLRLLTDAEHPGRIAIEGPLTLPG